MERTLHEQRSQGHCCSCVKSGSLLLLKIIIIVIINIIMGIIDIIIIMTMMFSSESVAGTAAEAAAGVYGPPDCRATPPGRRLGVLRRAAFPPSSLLSPPQ